MEFACTKAVLPMLIDPREAGGPGGLLRAWQGRVRTKAYQSLRHLRAWMIDPEYRQADRETRADFLRFYREQGGAGLKPNLLPAGKPRTALLVSQAYYPFAKLETLVVKALEMAGFKVVLVRNRRFDFLRYSWLAGAETGWEYDDFPDQDDAWAEAQVARLRRVEDWLALEYQGVHIGRFVIASTMRRLRVGQIDFTSPEVCDQVKGLLKESVRRTLVGIRLFERYRPACVVVMDRGYSGSGELFDLALARGVDAVTWHLGYKSNRLVFKRYHAGNERDHPLRPSDESWRRICSLPWTPEHGEMVRRELFECYENQDWFSVVGTQFGKRIHSQRETRAKLGLTSDRKVAVIFPHILWDGSFFYGDDLCGDYTRWLIDTVRAACANDRVDWLIKLHPAHVVKARQVGDQGAPCEVDVLRDAIGELPGHVHLIHPDTDLSTYSLFEIADYAVTVRGTVGIEAALFGVPVLTAGTGRYDRRGFTVDSSTREEYLERLATLETQPRLTPAQLELAERFAYATLFWRPLTLSCATLEYERHGKAIPRVTIHCQTRAQWLRSPDMRTLAAWLAEGRAEDMPPALAVEPSPAGTEPACAVSA